MDDPAVAALGENYTGKTQFLFCLFNNNPADSFCDKAIFTCTYITILIITNFQGNLDYSRCTHRYDGPLQYLAQGNPDSMTTVQVHQDHDDHDHDCGEGWRGGS